MFSHLSSRGRQREGCSRSSTRLLLVTAQNVECITEVIRAEDKVTNKHINSPQIDMETFAETGRHPSAIALVFFTLHQHFLNQRSISATVLLSAPSSLFKDTVTLTPCCWDRPCRCSFTLGYCLEHVSCY